MNHPFLRYLLIIVLLGAHTAISAPPVAHLPAGATALFDGADVGRWRPDAGHAAWSVVDGALVTGEGALRSRQEFANYELHVDYSLPADAGDKARIRLNDSFFVALPGGGATTGQRQSLDLTFQTVDGIAPMVSAWLNGKPLITDKGVPGSAAGVGGFPIVLPDADSARAPMGKGNAFTVVSRFRTRKGGTLFARSAPAGKWVPNGKALYIKGGKLVYDIGWLGALEAKGNVADGKWHTVVLTGTAEGNVQIYLDGKLAGEKAGVAAPDGADFRFKIGEAATDFGGRYEGDIADVGYFSGAWSTAQSEQISRDGNVPGGAAVRWQPAVSAAGTLPAPAALPVPVGGGATVEAWRIPFVGIAGQAAAITLECDTVGVRFANIWIRPLLDADAKNLIERWSEETFANGEKIYNGLCVTCHGTPEKEGSLPTALKFHEGQFKNGNDPVSMYRTLSYGFGQMMPQAWMTPQQKFEVIHYIREAVLKGHNPSQYSKVDDEYLANLPKVAKVPVPTSAPPAPAKRYVEMNYGASLNWTLQVGKDENIVQKGIITRLDDGPGGIVPGRAWAVFDHDLMQWGAAWTGKEFVDWRGIAFDGSHGTHTSLKGDTVFVNPQAPGWANPETGSWEDPRFQGRDTTRRFGPLPRSWAHYQGLYKDGNNRVISYSVGDAKILEQATIEYVGGKPVVVRTMNFANVGKPLRARLAPIGTGLAVRGDGFAMETVGDFRVLVVPVNAGRVRILLGGLSDAEMQQYAAAGFAPADLSVHTKGGPRQWTETAKTTIVRAADKDAYVVDTLTVPYDNPTKSWMRLSGIDFYPDGKRAAVCTWQGDVWLVDGLSQAEGELTWTRIASGMFQPLGLKIVDNTINVGCRNEIARLHDLNGDGEIDYYESFNNDHQVTEHFHEFAMGLQTDADGNFYYAKSARHAKPAVVPHHGTLLKVSKDGLRTEILANGFRAANGVCVNDDGTFFVTDQEGHWTPKNRINLIKPNVEKPNFYGNWMGYHDGKSQDDSEMQEPMIWLTNAFNRSPGELMWANSDKWGPLDGQLLELSYGMGRIFLNLREKVGDQWQGGQVKLPIPDFDTGVMRGRFSPADGQLYALGMFAWAGNKQNPGNFYRIRYTGKPTLVPTGLRTSANGLEVEFPCQVDAAKSTFAVKSWHIRRTGNYGSKHENEKDLAVIAVTSEKDGRTLKLTVDGIAPTRCMSIKGTCRTMDGTEFSFEIDNTIHQLGGK